MSRRDLALNKLHQRLKIERVKNFKENLSFNLSANGLTEPLAPGLL